MALIDIRHHRINLVIFHNMQIRISTGQYRLSCIQRWTAATTHAPQHSVTASQVTWAVSRLLVHYRSSTWNDGIWPDLQIVA